MFYKVTYCAFGKFTESGKLFNGVSYRPKESNPKVRNDFTGREQVESEPSFNMQCIFYNH